MTDTLLPEVHQLNALFLKVQAYKAEHPEAKLSFYPGSIASLLNAYREGDVSFDECIEHIKALAPQTRAEVPEGCRLVAHDTGDGWYLGVEDSDGAAVAMLEWPESWPESMSSTRLREFGFVIV